MRHIALLVALLALPAFAGEIVILSDVYTVDGLYRSMRGPVGVQKLLLGQPGKPPELLWITGYETTIVDVSGEKELDREFVCHANLDVDPADHLEKLPVTPAFGPRLFTLAQGQTSARFPEGFGIPVLSTEILSLQTQVLNLNHPEEITGTAHLEIDADPALDSAILVVIAGHMASKERER